MLSAVDHTFKYYFCLHTSETLTRLENTPKLVIAALNGHVVGGGLEIALACDIRIARKGGGKLGLPEANLGLMPGSGGTQRAARLIGKSRAMQLMIEGQNLDFERALEMGSSQLRLGSRDPRSVSAEDRRLRAQAAATGESQPRGGAHQARGAGGERDESRAGARVGARAAERS